eukprot:SAG25_NODE_1806_length_2310_cov_1.842153_1_plen_197_part_00
MLEPWPGVEQLAAPDEYAEARGDNQPVSRAAATATAAVHSRMKIRPAASGGSLGMLPEWDHPRICDISARSATCPGASARVKAAAVDRRRPLLVDAAAAPHGLAAPAGESNAAWRLLLHLHDGAVLYVRGRGGAAAAADRVGPWGRASLTRNSWPYGTSCGPQRSTLMSVGIHLVSCTHTVLMRGRGSFPLMIPPS